MSIMTDLLVQPGVVAAGEYAYRGDRFSHRGALSEEYARIASIMCRATTMSVHMEGAMLDSIHPGNGLHPPHGWLVRGPAHTFCVMANVFCLFDHTRGSVNDIVGLMRQTLGDVSHNLI